MSPTHTTQYFISVRNMYDIMSHHNMIPRSCTTHAHNKSIIFLNFVFIIPDTERKQKKKKSFSSTFFVHHIPTGPLRPHFLVFLGHFRLSGMRSGANPPQNRHGRNPVQTGSSMSVCIIGIRGPLVTNETCTKNMCAMNANEP